MDAMQQTQQAESQGPVLGGRKGITCDQVAWMLNAINRYLPPNNYPAVSRSREMQSYALLYELMEVAGLKFADELAQRNGTPPDVRHFLPEKKEATITTAQRGIAPFNPLNAASNCDA